MTHHPLPDLQEDLRIIREFCGFKELGQEPVYPDKPRFIGVTRRYIIEPDATRLVALLMDERPDLQALDANLAVNDEWLICYTLVNDRVTAAVWCDSGEAVNYRFE